MENPTKSLTLFWKARIKNGKSIIIYKKVYEDTLKMEKEYDDFSPEAKKGINKFSRLSSKNMRKYMELYDIKENKRSGVDNKEDFYEFVARNKLRGKK